MEQFREALVHCGLSDLGYRGSKFTWSNGHPKETFMKERLDRAVANKEWCGLFKNREVSVLPARTSDHKPLLLSIFEENAARPHFQKSFKFKAHWLADSECMEVITNAWGAGGFSAGGMQATRERLAHCQTKLSHWSDKKYHDVERVLKEKSKKLEELQRYDEGANWPAIKILKGEIDSILEHEDVKWKQRAKQNWFTHGDRNTPYYHAWASHRRKVNKIEKIIDEGGREWKKQNDIG
jgi:hypothetical protein